MSITIKIDWIPDEKPSSSELKLGSENQLNVINFEGNLLSVKVKLYE